MTKICHDTILQAWKFIHSADATRYTQTRTIRVFPTESTKGLSLSAPPEESREESPHTARLAVSRGVGSAKLGTKENLWSRLPASESSYPRGRHLSLWNLPPSCVLHPELYTLYK
eukprot:g7352.t1